MNDAPPDAVIRGWHLAPDRVSAISVRGNTHWRAARGTETVIVRRYRTGQTAASIEFEFRVLGHLKERGWPVTLPASDVVWSGGVTYVIFRGLPGRPREEGSTEKRERGRILARLHRDLASLGCSSQRAGWLRLDEVVAADGYLGEDDEIGAVFHSVRDRLASLNAAQLPISVIHGDLIAQNLLFDGAALTGILDFDSTHIDLRAADVGCARRSRDDEVVRGYLEEAALSDDELASLDDLWRAAVLRYALQLLENSATIGDAAGELEWCRRQLKQTVPFEG